MTIWLRLEREWERGVTRLHLREDEGEVDLDVEQRGCHVINKYEQPVRALPPSLSLRERGGVRVVETVLLDNDPRLKGG